MLRCIDIFAGAGGFSAGARAAGAAVLWAANHWKPAVDTHAANFPDTQHLCQNVDLANPTLIPEHDLCMAAPSCVGHTRSRGKDRPHHDAARATAFAFLPIVDYHRPKFLLVENVEEFRDRWDGFNGWCTILRDWGYELTVQTLNSAEFGVPQDRTRLFIVGVRHGAPLPLKSPGLPPVPASRIIDWERGSWSPIEKPGRSPNTLGRIANSRHLGERFLIYYNGSAEKGRCLSRPIGTITTTARWALVDRDRMRMLTTEEIRRASGFPENYRLPGPCRAFPTERYPQGEPLTAHEAAVAMFGNAVPPPVGRELVRQITARHRALQKAA